MSLFDKLKDTKFKSLKFGYDKPGGGTSPEPIIQQPIKDNNLVGMEKTVADTAAENRDRISKLIKSTPRGINFITKQKGLQLSNARLELPKTNIFGAGVNKSTRLTPITFYSKETLLTQEGGNIGDHFDRFGLTPFMEDSYKYINIATSNNTTKNNRLVELQNKLETKYYKLTPNVSITQSSVNILKSKVKGILSGISTFTNTLAGISNIFGGSPFLNQLNNKISGISKLTSPFLDPQIDQYIGGPGSKFGIGTTNIRRFDFTNDLDRFRAVKELSDLGARNGKIKPDVISNGASFAYNTNINAEPFSNVLPTSQVINTFTKLNNQKVKQHASYGGSNVSPVTSNQAKYNYIVALSNPEMDIIKDRLSDSLNYFGHNKQTFSAFDRNDGDNMSVVFQLIDPFSGNNLSRVVFSAYINGFKINSDATWNNISYIGRSEDLFVYSKYKRTASFNLQIPCFNIIELREKHRALGQLESSLAGKYSEDNKLGGILTKLYLGKYLYGEVGIINSLSYDIPNDSSWDIDEQLAHNINVSINFTIIHNELPAYREKGGFLGINIENAADGFLSSFTAISKAGASEEGDLNISSNRFVKITKTDNTSIQKGNQLTDFVTKTKVDNIVKQARNTIPTPQIPTIKPTSLPLTKPNISKPTKSPYAPSNLHTQLLTKVQPLSK